MRLLGAASETPFDNKISNKVVKTPNDCMTDSVWSEPVTGTFQFV